MSTMGPWVRIFAALVILCNCLLYAGEASLLTLQNRVVELYEQNRSAIVRVKAAYQGLTETGKTSVALKFGTGFYISREGHVMTNASVAYKADRVWVVHDGIEYAADIVGHDLPNKVTILKVNSTPPEFSFLHLSDSQKLQPIGSIVVRISAPLEFEPSPYLGLVSGYESEFGQIEFPTTYMRVTIPGGPGEGGAPLLDLNGKFVGMTIGGIEDMPSTSFVLPARAAMRLRDDIIFSGQVAYGWVGFDVESVGDTQNGRSIVVTEIIKGTPAESSGLLVGDVITRIADSNILNIGDVRDALFATRPDQLVTINCVRADKPVTIEVKIAKRPVDEFINQIPTPDEVDTGPRTPFVDEVAAEKMDSEASGAGENDPEGIGAVQGAQSSTNEGTGAEASKGEPYLSEELKLLQQNGESGMDSPIPGGDRDLM